MAYGSVFAYWLFVHRAVLGASVGLISGFILGLVRWHSWGIWVSALLGAVVGGYLGSYFQQKTFLWVGLVVGGAITLFSSFVGGLLRA